MYSILLYSLDSSNDRKSNEHLCHSSLKSIEMLINSDINFFLSHIQEIIVRLLSMSQYEYNMNIRMLALKCITDLAIKSQPNDIIKYQKNVCRQLIKCLGDKKRICRQIAVEARNRWYLLTTKNIDKEHELHSSASSTTTSPVKY